MFDLRLRDGHDTALTVCEGCGSEVVPVYVRHAGERERPAWWEVPGRERLTVEHTAARCWSLLACAHARRDQRTKKRPCTR